MPQNRIHIGIESAKWLLDATWQKHEKDLFRASCETPSMVRLFHDSRRYWDNHPAMVRPKPLFLQIQYRGFPAPICPLRKQRESSLAPNVAELDKQELDIGPDGFQK
jgi:hypothetical protein